MPNLREIEQRVLANGRVDGAELETLQHLLYADGKLGRKEADFLVVLHKRVRQRTPGFEKFFYKAIKAHVLKDGRIRAGETEWLRQMLWQDGKIDDEERKFLHQLKGEAQEVSPEFEALFAECMKAPQEQHTSG
jgi:hypothetical protein